MLVLQSKFLAVYKLPMIPNKFRSLLWASAFLSALTWPLLAQSSDVPQTLAGKAATPQLRLAQNPVAAPPAPKTDLRDLYSDTWVATDALGRAMPTNAQVGAPKADKNVGIFYFLWQERPGDPVNDLTKIFAANPENPQFGGVPSFHWWGEPLFGYYVGFDPFVIRKHAQMLADAGVDVMVFDNTNGGTYPKTYNAIFETFAQMRAQNIKTPAVAFFGQQKAFDDVWENVYSKNLHPELWYRWKGKPFIQVKPEVKLTPEQENFFSVRRSWAWSAGSWFGDGKDKWPWLDYSPQKPGLDADGNVEQISVAIAQHPTTSIGRSYSQGKEPPVDKYHNTPTQGQGIYFDEQWKRALEVSPEFIFVTGWNEWIAQRFIAEKDGTFAGLPQKKGDTFFVDAFSEEFSRDAEPSATSLGDNYYYQLAENIRRYKGARPIPTVASAPIQVDGNFADWNAVATEYRDTRDDEVKRNSPGWKGINYTNQTGRNDIVSAKTTFDKSNVTFMAQTNAPLSAPTGNNWMLLYIDADQNPKTGWMGYDFVVNMGGVAARTTTIRANLGGKYSWGEPRTIPFAMKGTQLELAIPRWILGANPLNFDFKWADNCYAKGDWTDFTLNGDAAPNDRFNYRFKGD